MSVKEIVVVSGKGGSGKTTLVASLCVLLDNKVIVDADADAADLHVLLKPNVKRRELFKGKSIARIDPKRCTRCDVCAQLCRFDAISVSDSGIYEVDPVRCDSCTLCKIACASGAIDMVEVFSGEWFESDTAYGKFIHARLFPGAENSGNLVTMVKHRARIVADEESIPYVLVDGSPGIGCPVISTLSDADFAIVVVEPTHSGFHDLKRLKDLINSFKLRSGIVINKHDVNEDVRDRIEEFAEKEDMVLLGRIPFDRCVMDALVEEKIAVEYCFHLRGVFSEILSRIIGEL